MKIAVIFLKGFYLDSNVKGCLIKIAGLFFEFKECDSFSAHSLLRGFFVPKNRTNRIERYRFSGYYRQPSLLFNKIIPYKVSQALAAHNGILVHAAAVVTRGRTFVFLGRAGAGKSTIVRLSQARTVLGDDIIALRRSRGHYYCFPTPWRQEGPERVDNRPRGPIRAIFFIKKADRVFFKGLKPEEALTLLMSEHVHFLTRMKKAEVKKIFHTASDLVRRVPAYEMCFMKEKNFWKKLERAVRAEKR